MVKVSDFKVTTELSRVNYLLSRALFSPSMIEVTKIVLKYYGFLAGGAILSTLIGRPINDFDFFFHSLDDYNNVYDEVKKLHKVRLIIETDNAATFKADEQTKFQLIKLEETLKPTIEEMLTGFDFTVCMLACTIKEDGCKEILHYKDSFINIAERRLVYNEATMFPIASLLRVRKYLNYGFKIPGVELLKMGLHINKLKINTFKELRRQILGIDTQFLKALTDQLETPELAEKEFDMKLAFELIEQHMEELLPNLMEQVNKENNKEEIICQ